MTGRTAPMNRQNEYFVPRDGIDREVITADICRYLGNDALVRPGTYENPGTGQVSQGYYITAYRNLTTAMIEDLKGTSRQWALERTSVATSVYRQSETHQRLQDAAGGVPAVSDPQYGNPNQPGYNGRPYQQPPQPFQANSGMPFNGQSQFQGGQDNYPYQPVTRSPPPRVDPYPQPGGQGYPEQPYAAGAHLRNSYGEMQQDRYGAPGGPARYHPQGSVPPQQAGYAPAAQGQQQQFYSGGQPAHGNHVPQVQVQPQDPFIGRSGKGHSYGSPDPSSYDDQSTRTVTPNSNAAAQPPPQPTGPRRDRDPRPPNSQY